MMRRVISGKPLYGETDTTDGCAQCGEVIPSQKSGSGKLPLLGSHRRKAGIAESDPVPGTGLLVPKAVAALEYKSGDGRSFATPHSFRCRNIRFKFYANISKGLMSPEGLL